MKNYYEILEVNKKASKEVIDKAYKVLIKKYHPDLAKGEKKQYAEIKTKDINEAYNVLSNDFLRGQYDIELEEQETINNYKVNTQNEEVNKKNNNSKNKIKTEKSKSKIGTFGSIVDLVENIMQSLKNRPRSEEIKSNAQKNIIAISLTIIIVIIIGIILWFLPFTNGWMRRLLFENPLFSWIGLLFSSN